MKALFFAWADIYTKICDYVNEEVLRVFASMCTSARVYHRCVARQGKAGIKGKAKAGKKARQKQTQCKASQTQAIQKPDTRRGKPDTGQGKPDLRPT